MGRKGNKLYLNNNKIVLKKERKKCRISAWPNVYVLNPRPCSCYWRAHREHREHCSRDPPPTGRITGDTCQHGSQGEKYMVPQGAPVGPAPSAHGGDRSLTGFPDSHLPSLALTVSGTTCKWTTAPKPGSDLLRKPKWYGSQSTSAPPASAKHEYSKTRAAFRGREKMILVLELHSQTPV